MLGAVALQLQDDLGRGLVVRSLEDLDHVVAAKSDVHADKAAAGLADDPLPFLDAIAPRGQTGDPL